MNYFYQLTMSKNGEISLPDMDIFFVHIREIMFYFLISEQKTLSPKLFHFLKKLQLVFTNEIDQ